MLSVLFLHPCTTYCICGNGYVIVCDTVCRLPDLRFVNGTSVYDSGARDVPRDRGVACVTNMHDKQRDSKLPG